MGIVPYEESAGTHCAFVAKIVEYVASGLPAVCTPLKSIRRYFQNDPLVKFSEFNGADFGEKILGWLDEPPAGWQPTPPNPPRACRRNSTGSRLPQGG